MFALFSDFKIFAHVVIEFGEHFRLNPNKLMNEYFNAPANQFFNNFLVLISIDWGYEDVASHADIVGNYRSETFLSEYCLFFTRLPSRSFSRSSHPLQAKTKKVIPKGKLSLREEKLTRSGSYFW